tara:strand:+ start:829 stop:1383 length:555 start_codon:yes stop_codon:yes gene_type:complete
MINPLSPIEKGLVLVSGPSKSGKSRLAEYLLKDHKQVTYIATSPHIDDIHWMERVSVHKKRRPKYWKTIESPSNLSETIKSINNDNSILIDSLGSFVFQYIDKEDDYWNSISSNLIDTIKQSLQLIVIVIEETGWGVVPSSKIGNHFRDRLGTLSQCLEISSKTTWLAIQGRAINLNKISTQIP